jgi:predicted RNA-binding Zn-ribbon protein involved in translation (DUF1610 family)
MSDVERVFRLLVRTLAEVDPTWLHRPIPLGAMTREIIPYRDVRNRLALACNEDYESLLIRLCAGQDGLAELTDPDAREHFALAAASPHPDLDFVRRWGDTTVSLDARAVARALSGESRDEYAPRPAPDPAVGSAPPPPEELLPEPPTPDRDARVLDFPLPPAPSAPASTPASSTDQCIFCGGALPADREARYCPHCGQNQVMLRCPNCDAEVEIGWRHCITCGQPLPHL